MSLHTEAVKRGMPEGLLSDDEIADWWYSRDLDHLAVVVQLRNENQRLREMLDERTLQHKTQLDNANRLRAENQRLREALGRFVDGQFASLAEQGLVRDEARKLLGQGRGEE